MKQPSDKFTLELIDKPKRGRPRKPDALTDAERARKYRAKKRAQKVKKTTPNFSVFPSEKPEKNDVLPWWKDPANKVNRLTGLTAAETAKRNDSPRHN